jgi:hypothetical protein
MDLGKSWLEKLRDEEAKRAAPRIRGSCVWNACEAKSITTGWSVLRPKCYLMSLRFRSVAVPPALVVVLLR